MIRATGPFRHLNVRLYAWFTIAFNARFYYPIFAILFLDLGLSLEQFVILNAIWAATIFLAEVPSGALADIIGRRKLLITAGALMIFEMAALLFAPADAGMWLFGICVVNRILSGLAEAAASGADQALTYDTLQEHGEEDTWDDVLEVMMRWKSGAVIFAMILGAGLYDPRFINQMLQVFHESWVVTQQHTLRIPIFLCLLQGIIVFLISLQFSEKERKADENANFTSVFRQTWKAARWVFTTKMAILIVSGGVIIDAITRNFTTINSEYYRLIDLPAYTFGLIAAASGLFGFCVPKLSKHLVRNFSPLTNLTLTAIWVFFSLLGIAQAWSYWGVIPAFLVMAGLWHLDFIMSRYLNDLASSDQRATVLSVKCLIFNLGYGAMSLIFSGLVIWERKQQNPEAFTSALGWQPWGFALVFLIFFVRAKFIGIAKSTR